MFAIEKDVPLPVGGIVLPFDSMEINDSFFVPQEKADTVHSYMSQWNKANPDKRMTSRTIDDGRRFWRIK